MPHSAASQLHSCRQANLDARSRRAGKSGDGGDKIAQIVDDPRDQLERRFAAEQAIDRNNRHLTELEADQLGIDRHFKCDRPTDFASRLKRGKSARRNILIPVVESESPVPETV